MSDDKPAAAPQYAWETLIYGNDPSRIASVQRFAVPGGWLFRVSTGGDRYSVEYVPDPDVYAPRAKLRRKVL